MQDEPKSTGDRRYYIFALRIMGEIVYLIAVPVVVLALVGKWLDGKFGTKPWLLITGFVLAALISGFSVWRRAKELGKEYQALDEKNLEHRT